jgi:hypothetical protein
MKKQISKLILLMVPIMLLISCNKDKFSEKDALTAQQTIDLLITVVDASSSLTPLQGATVTIINDSTVVAKTTNTSGTVVFSKIKISAEAQVTVSMANYTSVIKTVSTTPDSYRQTQVSAMVSVYSLASDKLATFSGRLTMQSDLTDRNREPAAGFVVKAKNTNLNYGTDQIFTSTTDADGKYSISIPVSSNGDNIQLYYPDFTANQTLAIVKPDNSVGVVTRSVLYRSNYYPIGDLQNIPAIPSVYATIGAPPTVTGSGFVLSSKANRVALTSYTPTPTLIDGGAGYAKGRTVADTFLLLSADPGGVSAKLEVAITKGKISTIFGFSNLGATYSSAPSFLQSGATTPAVVSINFQTTYKLYISNRGTNYSTFPIVSAETETYSSGTLVKAVDANINDAVFPVTLGNSNILTNNAIIYGGIIKGPVNDTLLAATANSFASAPIFTVVNPTSKPAILSVNTNSVNVDSTLNSIAVASGGSGYNPDAPPAITLTTLAGYGTGAVAKATVSTSGVVNNTIFITNPGVKYVKNVNDFRKNGTVGSTPDPPDSPITSYTGIKPGDVTVQDVYYGTGYQVLNQSTGK